MAITNARILIRRGLEADFNPDGLQPGEWALSVDRGNEILRVCVSPGEFIRIATYESFEKDMAQIETILAECKTIEEAVRAIQEETNAKDAAFESYVQQAKEYSETAAAEASKATTEADRSESEADRATVAAERSVSSWNPALNKLGAKNLGKNIMSDATNKGIVYKVQSDGTVITTGGNTTNTLASSSGNPIFKIGGDVLEVGQTYILSGCPDGGGANSYRLTMAFKQNGKQMYVSDLGNGISFTYTEDIETEILVYINVSAGTSVDGLVWKPMIRLASIADDTYEPYAMTNKELTEKILKGGTGEGTTNYESLENKPSVNGVELSGNKTTSDLGITAESVGADAAGSASTALSDAKDYTDNKISDLVGGAPETLNTLKEISDALTESGEAVEAINQAIGNKLDKTGDSKDNTVTFTQSSTRASIASAEKHSTLFGKIAKWFADLKTVAFSGSYNDLSDKPTIPTVNNATLTIQKNGSTVQTFTANASSNKTANIEVPTKTSELTNDSGFMSSATALDTYEEIMANTENGKFAGAKGVKEGFSKNLGGCEFSVESDGAYVTYTIGTDTVKKKLGSGNIQCFNADSVTYSVSGDYQLTFDLSSVYDKYQELTIDNICGGFSSVSSSTNAALIRSSSATFKQIDNYDNSNGIITYTITIFSQSSNRTVTAIPCFYICG